MTDRGTKYREEESLAPLFSEHEGKKSKDSYDGDHEQSGNTSKRAYEGTDW